MKSEALSCLLFYLLYQELSVTECWSICWQKERRKKGMEERREGGRKGRRKEWKKINWNCYLWPLWKYLSLTVFLETSTAFIWCQISLLTIVVKNIWQGGKENCHLYIHFQKFIMHFKVQNNNSLQTVLYICVYVLSIDR